MAHCASILNAHWANTRGEGGVTLVYYNVVAYGNSKLEQLQGKIIAHTVVYHGNRGP